MNIVEAGTCLIMAMIASILLMMGALYGPGGGIMMIAGLACFCIAPTLFLACLFSDAWRSDENLWKPTGRGMMFWITAMSTTALGVTGAAAALF